MPVSSSITSPTASKADHPKMLVFAQILEHLPIAVLDAMFNFFYGSSAGLNFLPPTQIQPTARSLDRKFRSKDYNSDNVPKMQKIPVRLFSVLEREPFFS